MATAAFSVSQAADESVSGDQDFDVMGWRHADVKQLTGYHKT